MHLTLFVYTEYVYTENQTTGGARSYKLTQATLKDNFNVANIRNAWKADMAESGNSPSEKLCLSSFGHLFENL